MKKPGRLCLGVVCLLLLMTSVIAENLLAQESIVRPAQMTVPGRDTPAVIHIHEANDHSRDEFDVF